MKTAIVIPARYASTRLPGKPLLRQTGKYLVQHVYERACQAQRRPTVVVATDDPRIVAAVESFGGRVVMTRRDHPSGTDRVAEVARHARRRRHRQPPGRRAAHRPGVRSTCCRTCCERDPDADMATLAVPIASAGAVAQPELRQGGLRRRRPGPVLQPQPDPVRPRRPARLRRPAAALPAAPRPVRLPPRLPAAAGGAAAAPLEQLEKLEQLRVLALGRRIQVGVVDHAGRRRRHLRRLRALRRRLTGKARPAGPPEPCRGAALAWRRGRASGIVSSGRAHEPAGRPVGCASFPAHPGQRRRAATWPSISSSPAAWSARWARG